MHEHCTPQRGGSRYPAMKTTVNESSSPSSSFKCCARRACPLTLVGTRAQALAKRTRDGCREVGRFRINPERMFVSPKTLAICCEQKTVLISFCWVQNYHSSAHNLLSPVGMALSFGFSFRCEQLLFFWVVGYCFLWLECSIRENTSARECVFSRMIHVEPFVCSFITQRVQ